MNENDNAIKELIRHGVEFDGIFNVINNYLINTSSISEYSSDSYQLLDKKGNRLFTSRSYVDILTEALKYNARQSR